MPAKKHIRLTVRNVLRLYCSGCRSIKSMATTLDANTAEGRKQIRAILEMRGYRLKRYLWTPREIELLSKGYADVDARKIAKRLHRPLWSIYGKAASMGLHKSEAWRARWMKRWIRLLLKTGKKHRFKEGHVTWNAGVHGLKYPGSEKGQFKKGHRSKRWHSYRNGMIVVRQDKSGSAYKYIRVSAGHWVPLHRYRWEQHRGPIPTGKLITFRNRNALDCRISNLLMIDRKEHGARWTFTNGGIAKMLAARRGGKGRINERLFVQLLKRPALLEAKRRQLELERRINAK